MEIAWLIVIGLAAGWLAGRLMTGGGFGLIGDIVVGVIGALLGGFLFRTVGVSIGGGCLVNWSSRRLAPSSSYFCCG